MESLMAGFSEFLKDPASILPDLTSTLGKVELVVRIAVLIGPLVLLALGLIYFLAPPREANYTFGFRTRRSMASVEAWQFTQRLAGIILSVLGLALTVVMAIVTAGFRGGDVMYLVTSALLCVLWELALVAVAYLSIVIVVMVCFDAKGFRRKGKKTA